MFKATKLDKSTRTGQVPFRELHGVCAEYLWGPPGFKGLERGEGITVTSRKEQPGGEEGGQCKVVFWRPG